MRVFLIAVFCLLSLPAAILKAQTPAWLDLQVNDNLAYLLQESPPQILRYNLDGDVWLSPLALSVTPTCFAVSDEHIFVGYGRALKRIDIDGGGEVHVANAPEDFLQLFLDGDVLIANTYVDRNGRITTYNTATFSLISQQAGYVDRMVKATHVPEIGKLLGHDGSDTLSLEVGEDGMIGGMDSGEFDGDYSSKSPLWVFPDHTKLAVNTGSVYNTVELAYANSFGIELQDLAFHEDVPIALSGNELIAFTNTLKETGRYELDTEARDIVIEGADIHVFYEDAQASGNVGVQIVPMDAFEESDPGEPITVEGLAYTVDDSVLVDGVLYILSKDHNSLFRWDLEEQKYLESIPLPDVINLMAYSEVLDRIFLASPNRRIYRLDLEAADLEVVQHVNVAQEPQTLTPLGRDLMVLANGSRNDMWIYSENGDLLEINTTCCYRDHHFYDENTSTLYYDNYWITYLGNGEFGKYVSGNNDGPFLALSADSRLVIDEGGVIFEAGDLSTESSLSNNIVRAGWNAEGVLYTLKEPANLGGIWDVEYEEVTTLQKWGDRYGLQDSAVLESLFVDFHVGEKAIAVITTRDGYPIISRFDFDLNLIPPETLSAPGVSIASFSATAANVAWRDVFGETSYVVKRRVNGQGEFTSLGVVGTDTDNFTDFPLQTGNFYEYRVKAMNGAVESEFSNVAELDLVVEVLDGLDPDTVNVVPDDIIVTEDDKLYLFSEEHASIFVWDPHVQTWGRTIPLQEGPQGVAYSQENDALYIMYTGNVRSVGLNAENPVEVEFAKNDENRARGLAAAGPYVVVAVNDPSWNAHISYDVSGKEADRRQSRSAIHNGAWDEFRRRLFYFNSESYSSYVLKFTLGENGLLGEEEEEYHGSSVVKVPLRLKHDGTRLLLGSGRVLDTDTLEEVDALEFSVTDAIWGETLVTVSEDVVYTHDPVTLAATEQFASTRAVRRLMPLSDGSFVLVSETEEGSAAFDIYDSSFAIVPPETLAAPGGLEGSIEPDGPIVVTWRDISGEGGYRVERQTAGDGFWVTLGEVGANILSFVDEAVPEGFVYRYRVSAFNGDLASEASEPVELDLSVPDPTSGFTARLTESGGVELEWDHAPDVIEYKIERRSGGIDDPDFSWTWSKRLYENSTTYTDTSYLQRGALYTYRILPHNEIGGAEAWAYAEIQTLPDPPAVPYFWFSDRDATSITVRLSSLKGSDEVVVERTAGVAGSDSEWVEIARLSGSSRHIVDEPLEPETMYSYRAYTVNQLGSSDFTDPVQTQTRALPPPPAPEGVTAESLSSSEIKVSWDDLEAETGYIIYRRGDDPASWERLDTLEANTTSYIDSSVVEGTKYWYRLKSMSGLVASSYSSSATAVPFDLVTVLDERFDPEPSAVAWLEVLGGGAASGSGFNIGNSLFFDGADARLATTTPFAGAGGGTVSFDFRAGDDDSETAYWNSSESGEHVVLQYALDGGPWQELSIIETRPPLGEHWTTYRIDLPKLAPRGMVSLRWMQADHSGGGADVWAIDNLLIVTKKPPLPVAPPFILASASSARSVTVYWGSALGAATYILERQTLEGTLEVVELPAHQTYYADHDLGSATAYTYRVKASNAGGDSGYTFPAYVETYTEYDDWLFACFGTRAMSEERQMLAVGRDGVSNLEKYAFGIDPNGTTGQLEPDTLSAGGMPRAFIDGKTGALRVVFAKRRSSESPALTYTVEFSSDGRDWTEAGQRISSTVVDERFEVVEWSDDPSNANERWRLVRVRVIAVE